MIILYVIFLHDVDCVGIVSSRLGSSFRSESLSIEKSNEWNNLNDRAEFIKRIKRSIREVWYSLDECDDGKFCLVATIRFGPNWFRESFTSTNQEKQKCDQPYNCKGG